MEKKLIGIIKMIDDNGNVFEIKEYQEINVIATMNGKGGKVDHLKGLKYMEYNGNKVVQKEGNKYVMYLSNSILNIRKIGKKVDYCSAKIEEDMYCNCCGWPVVFACCNGSFQKFKDADDWDWWYYCSNKACEYHDGEGFFQKTPHWISRG